MTELHAFLLPDEIPQHRLGHTEDRHGDWISDLMYTTEFRCASGVGEADDSGYAEDRQAFERCCYQAKV